MRYLVPIGIVALLVAALAGIKVKQISGMMKAGAAMKKLGPPPESVGTAAAREDRWEGTLSSVGTVAAVRGVAITTEVPGVVAAIRFESGQTVRAGQVLLELDSSVERAQLASAKARKDLAESSLARSENLAGNAAISKAQLDTDQSALKTSAADVAALQAQIERKTIRAPFAGRLGIRAVNLGQFLSPGTVATVLESQGAVYVDFSLPQEEHARIKVGTPVRITLEGRGGETLDGAIAAIDPSVDAATRALKLRAGIANPGDRLQAGMFVRVAVVLPDRGVVVTAPATAVVHASYGDSVFVVEDKHDEAGGAVKDAAGNPAKVARQQFVRVGASRGDFVAIAEGVRPGQELVSAGAFKLRNGANIVIHNEVRPTPALAPHVENR